MLDRSMLKTLESSVYMIKTNDIASRQEFSKSTKELHIAMLTGRCLGSRRVSATASVFDATSLNLHPEQATSSYSS